MCVISLNLVEKRVFVTCDASVKYIGVLCHLEMESPCINTIKSKNNHYCDHRYHQIGLPIHWMMMSDQFSLPT